MNELKKDVFIGSVSFLGIVAFVSGQFILSTMMFGVAALWSTILLNNRVQAVKNWKFFNIVRDLQAIFFIIRLCSYSRSLMGLREFFFA